MSATAITTTDGPLSCTVSVGATTWSSDGSFEDALRRADLALYKAKSLGRNRCVVSAGDTVGPDDVRRPA